MPIASQKSFGLPLLPGKKEDPQLAYDGATIGKFALAPYHTRSSLFSIIPTSLSPCLTFILGSGHKNFAVAFIHPALFLLHGTFFQPLPFKMPPALWSFSCPLFFCLQHFVHADILLPCCYGWWCVWFQICPPCCLIDQELLEGKDCVLFSSLIPVPIRGPKPL